MFYKCYFVNEKKKKNQNSMRSRRKNMMSDKFRRIMSSVPKCTCDHNIDELITIKFKDTQLS